MQFSFILKSQAVLSAALFQYRQLQIFSLTTSYTKYHFSFHIKILPISVSEMADLLVLPTGVSLQVVSHV